MPQKLRPPDLKLVVANVGLSESSKILLRALERVAGHYYVQAPVTWGAKRYPR